MNRATSHAAWRTIHLAYAPLADRSDRFRPQRHSAALCGNAAGVSRLAVSGPTVAHCGVQTRPRWRRRLGRVRQCSARPADHILGREVARHRVRARRLKRSRTLSPSAAQLRCALDHAHRVPSLTQAGTREPPAYERCGLCRGHALRCASVCSVLRRSVRCTPSRPQASHRQTAAAPARRSNGHSAPQRRRAPCAAVGSCGG